MNECLMLEFIRKWLLEAIAIFTIATISACSSSSPWGSRSNPSAIDESGLVDVADITQNPESYIGRSVLVPMTLTKNS